MLYDVSALLIMLAIAAADSNSHQRFKSTPKPDISIDGPSLPKSFDPPTHISEFTDPDTGLNPFLDLEEGPTFIGRNIMKDDTRQEDPPFMDFNIMEGEGSNRQWLEFNVPKQPVEESIPRWVPFEEEVKLEDFKFPTTVQTNPTDTDETVLLSSTTSDYEQTHDQEIFEDDQEKVIKELQISIFSNVAAIYVTVAIVIVAIFLLLLGGCYWRKKFRSRTSRSPATVQSGELKC